ncbi:MAG: V-type ATP synthase subunit E [Treponema sp.]|jgi:V/A-type H+-transporting ATPase subunit E|nr:V-type ATP synthase subunit E [Treponema sp.]
MEIQLQELIDKIKREGIETASQEAAALRARAEAEAKRIVEAAKKEAADITAQAKQDAARFEKAGQAALAQASRNLVLAFKGEIDALLARIAARETAAAYDAGVLKAALPDILKNWAAKDQNDLAVLLPAKDAAALEAWFTSALAAELKKGVTLKADRSLGAGFRIAERDGSAYYDFSAEAAAELLSAYLNPQLAAILKDAAKAA